VRLCVYNRIVISTVGFVLDFRSTSGQGAGQGARQGPSAVAVAVSGASDSSCLTVALQSHPREVAGIALSMVSFKPTKWADCAFLWFADLGLLVFSGTGEGQCASIVAVAASMNVTFSCIEDHVGQFAEQRVLAGVAETRTQHNAIRNRYHLRDGPHKQLSSHALPRFS
jgi:hypothetical protein